MPELSAFRAQPGSRMETPLCRVAQEFASLTGWRRYGLAFLLGIVLAAAFPPVDLTPIIFVSFPGLLWLDDGSRTSWASARLAYVFALGFFTAGLYWIAAALFVDITAYWWALPFAVLGLPAFLSFYPAAGMLATAWLARRFKLNSVARVCLFAVAWSAAEWLRGHLLTGMPWNLTGYVWSGAFPGSLAVLQSVAAVGIYGLGLITIMSASLLALLGIPSLAPISPTRRWAPVAVSVALILLPAVGGAIRLEMAPVNETGTWLRLVQPSIPQTLKWDPRAASDNFRRLAELSAAKAAHPLAAILWPEAAATSLIERDPAQRKAMAAMAPKGGYLVTGALRANPPPGPVTQIWNSVEAVDGDSAIRATYDKAHLVPFGEYMPFRGLLPFKKITAGAMDLSAGPGATTISLPGLPTFAPQICYEAIFPAATVDHAARPAWLLNVTNDAWYGRSSGPYQHFAIARSRAVEEGLPLIRVANNGISGVVDAEGRVLARTNLDDVTYADVALPSPGSTTPYALLGDWVFLILLAIGLIPIWYYFYQLYRSHER